MNEAYLLTGGNVGDRPFFLHEARTNIAAKCGPVDRLSALYETAAWGSEQQAAFLNQVMRVHTTLSPTELLDRLLQIEAQLGRKRSVRYAPRTIDIDLLFFNDEVISLKSLTVPHPQMAFRRFVLVPLSEIAPGKKHPLLHKTVAELLEACPDPLPVYKIT